MSMFFLRLQFLYNHCITGHWLHLKTYCSICHAYSFRFSTIFLSNKVNLRALISIYYLPHKNNPPLPKQSIQGIEFNNKIKLYVLFFSRLAIKVACIHQWVMLGSLAHTFMKSSCRQMEPMLKWVQYHWLNRDYEIRENGQITPYMPRNLHLSFA